MWLADALTVVRLPLAALFWLVWDRPLWAGLVLAAAALSDVLDGRLARRARRRRGIPIDQPSVGAWLDPICDKAFVLSVLAACWVHLGSAWPVVLAIAAREIVLLPLTVAYRLMPRARRAGYQFRAGAWGKAATLAQFVAVGTLVLRLDAEVPLAALAGLLGLIAAGDYVRRAVPSVRRWPAAPREARRGAPRPGRA